MRKKESNISLQEEKPNYHIHKEIIYFDYLLKFEQQKAILLSFSSSITSF